MSGPISDWYIVKHIIYILAVPSGPWSARTLGVARLPGTARSCPFRSLYAVFRARQLEVVHVS